VRHPIQAAIDARVSAAQPAEAHTIASQVAARRERLRTAGLGVPAALEFLDAGDRGATLVRPALARLRDAAAAGGLSRLDGHSPERLARKEAYQVLLVEECGRLGVAVVFLNRERGLGPGGVGPRAQWRALWLPRRQQTGRWGPPTLGHHP
jgi:site-specific DNA recombinase